MVSPDKAFGKQLATALKAAGGAVDLHGSLDELAPGGPELALLVVHFEGDVARAAPERIARLTGDTRVIAVLPRTNLAAVVAILQGSDRVAGMLIADELDLRDLSAMATRVIAGDIFGLDKIVRWGAQIHSALVGDYQEKARCISQVSEFAEQMGVRRKYRESIEQCLDEMLMNALYDAPVDEHGRQIFSEIPTRTRISLRVEQRVVVQYACDGKQFAVSVRDAFGALERATVLRYLHKCLHDEQQIDRKAGGAGLGLYLMTSSSTDVMFNVLPGVATEAVCTFDLEAPKLQLASFGYFTERIDAAGRLASGPSRRLPTGAPYPVERRARAAPMVAAQPRWLISLLVAAIVVTLALVGYAAWPRLFGRTARTSVAIQTVPPGAAIELDGKPAGTTGAGPLVLDLVVGRAYPVVARLDGHEPKQLVIQPRSGGDRAGNEVTVELASLAAVVTLDSTPTGAAVELEGQPAGTTPLTVTHLAPGSAVAIAFKKPGYQDATTRLEVPRPGKETRLIQPLVVAPELARIKLVSEPPGAQVMQNGQLLAGVVTPAEVLVEGDKPVEFVLALPDKVPAVIGPFTPGRGADGVVRNAKLVDGAAIAIAANLPATATVAGAPHCRAIELPGRCVVAPGSYVVELAVTGVAHPRIARSVRIDRATDVPFELGFVEAPAGKTIALGRGAGARRAAFEAGTRQIAISDGANKSTIAVIVKAGATTEIPATPPATPPAKLPTTLP